MILTWHAHLSKDEFAPIYAKNYLMKALTIFFLSLKLPIEKKQQKKVKQIEKIIKSTEPCNILAFIIKHHEDHNHVLFLLIVENRGRK